MRARRREAVLHHAGSRLLFLLCAGICIFFPLALAAQTATTPALLTTTRQIHQLSAEAAARQLPFRLRGVVTSLTAWPNSFFLEDATGGIYVRNDEATGVYEGAVIELTGTTQPGQFAPSAHGLHVHILGRRQMPPAREFTYHELMRGTQDSNWVAVRGVVRSARPEVQWGTPVLALTIEVDGGVILGRMMRYDAGDPARLVDAAVRIRGVCATKFNDKRQFTGVLISTPGMAYVDIEEPAPADPFALPALPVHSLLQYKPGQRFNHRVEVMGTVTYQDLGRSLYLQDGDDGVLVQTTQETPLRLGTKIAVIGFAGSGTYSPILSEAAFQVIQPGRPVEPVSIRANEFVHRSTFVVSAPYDAQVVRLRGQLLETTNQTDNTWLLRDGDTDFVAVLQRKGGGSPLHGIENGSIVSVTGVLSVQVNASLEPTSFRILLRGPEDLEIVKTASWWSPLHALFALAGVLLVTVAMTLWGATLRRTVRQQTQMLRESEERFRKQAQQDALTGLVSRLFLHEQLREAISRAKWGGEKIGILMIDLDHFKEVNDTLGHHAGDELLCLVADRLRASVRKADTVARMGGDEFVVLLADLPDAAEAEMIGAKIVANVSASAEIAGRPMPISASVGVCLFPDGGQDVDTLLQNVDAAMYKAKAAGRNKYAVFGRPLVVASVVAPQLAGARA